MAIKLDKEINLNELDKLPHANLQEIRKKIADQVAAATNVVVDQRPRSTPRPGLQPLQRSCVSVFCWGKMEPTSLDLKATGQRMWVCKRCGRVRFCRG